MEETTTSSDKNVYIGKVVAEKEKETVYSDTETKENQYSSDEKDEVEAKQTEGTIYSEDEKPPYSEDDEQDETAAKQAEETIYSEDEKDAAEAKQAAEIDVPKKPATQAKENVNFSDNEVDENNCFHQSFIGVSTLPKGSIQLNKKLGEGAFGQVYRGTWGKENRPVALKKIDVDHTKKHFKDFNDEQILESLQWEVTRLSTVNHPNCVQFYGIYQNKLNTRTYVVMEFCEGGTLDKALEQNPSWQKRWQWALEMSQGLAYLHDQGIVHRDLKAENILLNKSGCAQLADLGVAQVDALLQGRTATVVEQGWQDQRFIAPENVDKDMSSRINNKATDIYALGLVFWQLACSGSQAPRSQDNMERSDIYYWKRGHYISGQGQVCKREPLPKDCPPAFERLILNCWAEDPAKRPHADNIVAQLQVMDKALFPPEHHAETTVLKTCEQLEHVIHAKRLEGLHYVAPCVTEYEVLESIESYWSRFDNTEDKETETSKGNPPLKLMPRLEGFLDNPDCSVLVLLGDSGLGKSLSTYLFADQQLKKCWAYLNASEAENPEKLPYLPLFIRPAVEAAGKWSYSGIENGFEKAKAYYQLEKTLLPLLLIVDGYDECDPDKLPENLPQALGLPLDTPVKLIVTCRPKTVEKNELYVRFAFKHDKDCQVDYFLPFSLGQMSVYLTEQLAWDEATRQTYTQQLANTDSLKNVLRNPFVLQLFVHCFEGIPEEKLDTLKRWQIYEAAVAQWLDQDKGLLSPFVQQHLQGEYESLAESFHYFAGLVAFTAFREKTLGLSTETLVSLESPWGKLPKLIEEDAHATFHHNGIEITLLTTAEEDLRDAKKLSLRSDINLPSLIKFQTFEESCFYVYGHNKKGKIGVRKLSLPPEQLNVLPWASCHKVRLSNEKDDYPEIYHAIIDRNLHIKSHKRSVLSEEDFINIRHTQGQHCVADSPLKPRLSGMEFTHKSFFEYFAARHLLMLSRLSPEVMPQQASQLLADRHLTTEPQVLAFWREGWECSDYEETKRLIKPLFAVMAASKNCPEKATSASNAATLLAKVKIPFVNKDLQEVQLPEADLSEAVFSLSNFAHANLRGVNFRAACLTGVNFTEADMTDVNFGEWASLKGTSEVKSICYSRDGRYLAIAEGENIGIFEKIEGEYERIQTLTGHTYSVRSVAYSPDGRRLASGSDDETVRQWDVQSGKHLQTLKGHTSSVYCVAYSPDGSQLASGGGHGDNTVRQWDVQSGKPLQTLKGHTNWVRSVAYSPDGSQLASGSDDKTVRQWDVKSGKPLQTLTGHTGWVMSVAYSPDGSQLASGSEDKTVRQWDVKSGKPLQTLTGHTSSVECVAYSPDGSQLASGSFDNTVRQWDVKSGKPLQPLTGHTYLVYSVAYSPDGSQLASGSFNHTVRQWDVQSGKVIQTLTGHTKPVNCVAYSPDGSQLASGSVDKTVRQWDVKSGKPLQILTGHTSSVMSVAYSPDGSQLASGSSDHTVRQWDVQSGKVIQTLTGHTSWVQSVAYSPDGSQLASGSGDCAIFIWQRVETPLQVERWIIKYRFSQACTLWAQDTLLQGAVISQGNAKLLKQRGALSKAHNAESNVEQFQLQPLEAPLKKPLNTPQQYLQHLERNTQLFCSFFNTDSNIYSKFFEQGKQIAYHLKARDRQAMACVSQLTYKFFQTVPPPRPRAITPYENKPNKKPEKSKKTIFKKTDHSSHHAAKKTSPGDAREKVLSDVGGDYAGVQFCNALWRNAYAKPRGKKAHFLHF